MIIAATHSGSFHTDDVVSYSILKLVFGEFTFFRSRDQEVLNKADIVFDVGFGEYDHHMPDKEGKPYRDEDKTKPYSSAGLIWRDFGKEAIESVIHNMKIEYSYSLIERIWKIVDDGVILPVDLSDNGAWNSEFSEINLMAIVSSFTPSWMEEDNDTVQMTSFKNASAVVEQFLRNKISKLVASIYAEDKVIECYKKSSDARILELTEWMPWRYIVEEKKLPITYVIYPTPTQWRIETMHQTGNVFSKVKPLPEAWSGLRDEEFQKVTGVQDATFCHPALFTAGAKSHDGIMKLVEEALA